MQTHLNRYVILSFVIFCWGIFLWLVFTVTQTLMPIKILPVEKLSGEGWYKVKNTLLDVFNFQHKIQNIINKYSEPIFQPQPHSNWAISKMFTNSKFIILNDMYTLKFIPFSLIPNNNVYFPLFIIFFLIATIGITIFQSYLTINGIFYILFFFLSNLVFLIVWISPTMFRENTQLIFEIKLYGIYIPSSFLNLYFSLDTISASFANLVLIISLAALVYSRVYLNNDPHITDFFIKLMWFVLSMLFLVISKNCFVLYFFWESIGITSAWLINYNSQRLDTLKSALKAFIFNKISDLTLFTGLVIGFLSTNTTNVEEWELVYTLTNATNTNILTHFYWCGVFIAVAACIKSAQLGFHIWLPDSMDAPVPASALIHSATLVSAGVYLLIRFNFFLSIGNIFMFTTVIGSLTAAYGGIAAATQTDLKRALAYSTISHCGFLFVLASLGTMQATLLYLFLHGFFKALSFICAGELIRNANSSQDINRNGSFFFLNPALHAQLLVAMGNLCGLPLFFGYLFKSSFQKVVLVNFYSSIAILTLLFIGLLSSIFYFVRIFWSTSFHFKKYNFKIIKEYHKPGLYFWLYPTKTPKALFIIFWFIYILSVFSVYYMFALQKSTFLLHFSDFYNLSTSYKNLTFIHELQTINYLFLFYNFFFWMLWVVCFYYKPTRSNTNNDVYKLSLILFFLLTIFLMI